MKLMKTLLTTKPSPFHRLTRLGLILGLTAPLLAQRVYRFHEAGGPQPMMVAASEIAVTGRPGTAERALLNTIGRYASGASILEKWDRQYLVFVPPPANPLALAQRTSRLATEPDIAEVAPVLYPVQPAPRLKSGEPFPIDARQWRLAGMRIVTRSVLVRLPDLTVAAGLRLTTGAASVAPAGTDDWWLFEYASPADALDAAIFMAETEKRDCTPVFARLGARKAGPSALTPNDTLFGSQWHLNSPAHGINVTATWDTLTGAGRNVTVIDGGIQITHPDISPNAFPISSGNHFDFVGNDPDPSPMLANDSHGTSAAGLALARGNNGIGVAGVAFLANLLAIRLLDGPKTDAQEQAAFTWRPALTEVSSNSWGAPDPVFLAGPGPLALAGLQSATATGRGGRGVFFVFAAGNGAGLVYDSRLYNDDSNYDGWANSRFVTAVGAVTDGGLRAYYSENGANVAISAPSSGGVAGLTTTDLVGTAGDSGSDYTNTFGGTSGATPIVAGAAALIIQSNPNLGWRDIKEILMRSASRGNLIGGDPFVTNGGGIPFSHSFGAGRVNVGAAVAMARTWTNLPPETSISLAQNGINIPVPDNNANGVVRSFDFSGQQDLRVETVELTVTVTHPHRGHLRFIIVSPSGMQSVVQHRFADDGDNFVNWTFTSVRHWGEHSAGTWTVRVADVEPLDVGVLNSVSLRIWGAPFAPVLGAPTINSPSPGQTINVSGVTFNWNAVSGASGYDLRIVSGSQTIFIGTLSGNTSTTTLVSLPAGTFTFQVRACNNGFADANCGPFASRQFNVSLTPPAQAPVISAPTPNQVFTISTQTFRWSSVTGAERYEVLLTNAAAGNTTELRMTTPQTSTTFSMRGSTRYELKVRACSVACGPWSAIVPFAVNLPPVPTAAPTITSHNIAGGNSLTVTWSAVANADLYVVQVVQPNTGPGGGALTVASIRTSALTVNLAVPAGPAVIIVAACNGNGCGPNSPQVNINPPGPNPNAPILGSPINGTVVDGPVVLLAWSRVPGDNGSNTPYRVFALDFSRDATALDVRTTGNFHGAYFVSEGTRYDALVFSNPGTGSQQQGPAVGFNVRGLSSTAPTMVSPQHQSTLPQGNITLGWTPVFGATLYEYYVGVPGSQQPTVRGVTPGLLVQVPLRVQSGGSTIYDGIVRACPAGSVCTFGSDAGWGPWSNIAGPGVTKFTITP